MKTNLSNKLFVSLQHIFWWCTFEIFLGVN